MSFLPIKIKHCIFDHTISKYLQKTISDCWRLVLSIRSRDHKWSMQIYSGCPMWQVTVADFGIPRIAGEWSYGILMTSVAVPDDLYLTGQYVNKSKLWSWTFSDFCYTYINLLAVLVLLSADVWFTAISHLNFKVNWVMRFLDIHKTI